MSATQEVMLLNVDLTNYPIYTLPSGYKFRMYNSGDDISWVNIQEKSEEYHLTMDLTTFRKEFNDNKSALRQRQIFVCDEQDIPIATATAWFEDDLYQKNSGRIHWVAVHPNHQGKGIANAMMTELMKIFLKLNHECAIVTTESFRETAIKIYLKFGFSPCSRNEIERQYWAKFTEKDI